MVKEITEEAALKLTNTKQNYSYGLVNTSNGSVKLLKVELQDYEGIKLAT